MPDYWFLENPVGMMKHIMDHEAELITWCQYGDPSMKPTYLFGDHPDSMEYRRCKNGADCHTSNPAGGLNFPDKGRDKAKRAAIPYGLSKAVLEAVENPDAEAGDLDVPDADDVAIDRVDDDQAALGDF